MRYDHTGRPRTTASGPGVDLPGAAPPEFLGGVIGAVSTVGSAIAGASGPVSDVVGVFSGGGEAPCGQPREGPFSVEVVTSYLRDNPGATEQLRQLMLSFSGWDCLDQFRSVANRADGVARFAVALAHGGQDGEIGKAEQRVHDFLQRHVGPSAVGTVEPTTVDTLSTSQLVEEDVRRFGRTLEGAAEGAQAGAAAGQARAEAESQGLDTQTLLLAGGALALGFLATR